MANNNIPLNEIMNGFQKIIAKEFDTYEKEITIKIDETIKEVANDFANDLMRATPRSDSLFGGKYGHLYENINVAEQLKNGNKTQIVNFGDKGYVSTFLEYGWTLRNGEFMRRTPFIRPLFEQNKEKYANKIKEAVARGGDNV